MALFSPTLFGIVILGVFFYKVDTAPRDGLVFEADLALEHHQLYTPKNHFFLGGEGGKVLLLG